jgi:hypothetical protein
MPWAAFLLLAGFAIREYGAFHYDNLIIYVVSVCLIMSGPPVYALINYMVLSRILYYVPYLSPMHPGRALTTFLAADFICEVLIANGAQMSINTSYPKTEQKVGLVLVKVALILQALLFAFFLLLGILFQRKASKAGVLKPNLRKVLIVMYISSVIITARCAYRIVEFFQGFTGFVYTHEEFFYIFEATIMFINTAMLNIWHPGRYLPRSNRVFLAQDGVTELRGPGWKSNRKFLSTLVDPFDLYGLFKGHDNKTKFWEKSPEELDRMFEDMEREKAAKRNQPRKAWQRVMDPFYVFGAGGKLRRLADRLDGNEDLESNVERLAKLQNQGHSKGTDPEKAY